MTAARLVQQKRKTSSVSIITIALVVLVFGTRDSANRLRFAVGQRRHALDYPRSKAICQERFGG